MDSHNRSTAAPQSPNPAHRDSADDQIRCDLTGDFAGWLARSGGALAVSTYQAGKLALVGWDGSQVTLLMRHFPKPMGIAVEGLRLVLACRDEVWFFANDSLLAPDYLGPGRYDALFLPRVAYFTGDVNVHDLAFGEEGLWLVNTRFCCLATLSDQYSFVPRWQPPFISQLVPEDRCHLNGLALQEGRPKYVTALGSTDAREGWRQNKVSGGILMDVATGEIAFSGLCMPHSPRWYDGRWWLLNSGRGEVWTVDPERGDHSVVSVLPGYLRGLAFVGSYALVGLSRIRENRLFEGLPVQQRFPQLRCGVSVLDLTSGRQVGMIEFTSGCQELYDVQFLPGVTRPTILSLQKGAARQGVTAPQFSYWLYPKSDEGPASASPMPLPTK